MPSWVDILKGIVMGGGVLLALFCICALAVLMIGGREL